MKVWMASCGQFTMKVASSLKGISEEIGASYSTMKNKAGKAEMFTVISEDMSVWFVINAEVRRVKGRGGFRVSKSVNVG